MKIARSVIAAASLAAATAMSFGPAVAADMPVKAAVTKVPIVAPLFDWTGWYGGLNYGTGASQTDGTTPNNGNTSFDRGGKGYSVGVQGGYNWQFSPHWVAGIEADIGWLGIDRRRQDWANANAFGVETDWYSTVRGRFGYSNGPSLFYITGGAAFVDVTNHYDVVPAPQASSSEIASGWTAGWGIETMLGGNWSAKAEYVYIDAGGQNVANPAVGFDPTAHFNNRFHVFRNALNYRFGGPSPASALPAHNWSGFYAGVNAGAGLSQVEATTTVVTTGLADIADDGFTGGVHAGFNWQLSPNWVGGVEADIGRLDINRTYREWLNTIVFGVKTDWYGTIRARIGRSTGPALLYVTGGAAFVRVKNVLDQVIVGTTARSETAMGWTIGGGIEAVLGNNWTAKTEYLYIDAGSQDVPSPNVGGAVVGTFDNRFHVFRFGLNYQFASGKAPVVTKY